MKRIIALFTLALTALLNPIHSQYNFDIGINFGGTGFLGDIGGTSEVAKGFLGDIVLKQTNITSGIYGRYKINSKIHINSGINYVKISGDDANSAGPRAWRNLRFQNQLFELNSCLEYTFFRINDLGGTGRYRTSLNLYAFVGGSVFYHNPKGAFLENANSPIKEWESLRPLKTEGQETPYSSISFSTPYGLGAIVKTATFYKFGIYFRYMKNYTDYLDDISTVYAHNASEGNIANQYNGPEEQTGSFATGQIRGNPKSLDDIFMLNLSFSKIISSKNNIYYADYLMKYKMPKKFKSKRGYGGRRNNTYQFKNFKKKKAKRTMRANF
ncbi:MAG: Uncharacterised protein [Crocinitomicaceae bacterium]|nr:MAG: Uncharacterised protein [Crocinitomicaceae bacterium]